MKMEVSEFQRIVNNGMGRTILYLQQSDSAPYREAILNACLHNAAYDAQVEGSRAQYMVDVIHLTHELDFYRNAILNALSLPNTDDWDVRHLLDQASIFAKAGDEHARQIVYDTVLNPQASDPDFDILVKLDGVNGLIAVIETIWQADSEAKQDFLAPYGYGNYLLEQLEAIHGADQTRNMLITAAESHPAIKEFLESIAVSPAVQTHSVKRQQSLEVSYDNQLAWLSASTNFHNPPVEWSTWGKYATDDDLVRAANDLLQLADDEVQKIAVYLKAFQKRMFPLDPTRLIFWASQIDNRSIWLEDGTIDYKARCSLYALNALEWVRDWRVRELALSLIKSNNNVGRAVALLAANFVEDDWLLIEELSKSHSKLDDYHNLGWSVLDVFEAYPTTAAITTLMNLYEFNPCSACRGKFVKCLASLNAVPQWMLEECKHDCNLDLREWALNLS